MATITVRALDQNGDPLQGNGQNNFISDLQAVAQIIRTRLLLFQGEWFLDQNDGLPLFNSMLGSSGSARNLEVITNLIASRIRETQYVLAITSIYATFQNRKYVFNATVQTQFGTLTISTNQNTAAISN